MPISVPRLNVMAQALRHHFEKLKKNSLKILKMILKTLKFSKMAGILSGCMYGFNIL